MSATTHALRESQQATASSSQAPSSNQPGYSRIPSGYKQPRGMQMQHRYMPSIDPNLAAIASGFGNMSIHGTNMQSPAWLTSAPYFYQPALAPTSQAANGLAHGVGHYYHQGGYPNGFGGVQPLLDSPVNASWPSMTSGSELPNLMASRRDSSSSNDLDVPTTPYMHYHGHANGVTVVNHSPYNAGHAWSTPSTGNSGYIIAKTNRPSVVSAEILHSVRQEPAIPPAVPAPCSPPKPLDRSLENPKGVTNVYVRGLQPDTTDELLYDYGVRFGEIDTSKAILDFGTGQCKGFGFIKYYNFKDAENCIRGFHCLGYETSFARESFYVQLKKLSDEKNTNLYISNLPKDMNEAELGGIFPPFKCCSSRILRDSMGNGRGVGFARFHNRATCEAVMKQYCNATVASKDGKESFQIQIRYADTQDQKSLKQTTAAARQYRSEEYESQTRHLQSPPGCARAAPPALGDFETYMKHATAGSQSSPNVEIKSEEENAVRECSNQVSVHLSSGATVRPSAAKFTKDRASAIEIDDANALQDKTNKELNTVADLI